jgi:hypothetical protein
MGLFPRVVRGRDLNTSPETLWAGFSCEPKRLRRRSQANSALEPPSLFDLDSIPASHAIDNVFGATPVEVTFWIGNPDGYLHALL